MTWQIQRDSTSTCRARWVVTEAGGTFSQPTGTALVVGTYTLGSGANAYSGSSAYRWGPLFW